jgi:hypothetical protein
MSTEEEFQKELQDIRNGYYELYKHNQFNYFVSQYKEHIDHLYDLLKQYYQVDYNQFVKLCYLTSI